MDRLNYLLVVGFFRLMSLLPARLARGIGRVIGYVLWGIHSETRQVTEINLRLCFPDLSKQQRRRLAQRSLQHLGMSAMEFGMVWSSDPAKVIRKITKVTGKEHLDAALAEQKGVMVLAPHIGNWEVMGLWLAERYTLTNMYQPPENPALDQFISRARVRNGSSLVPTNTSGVKSLLRALKRGELVGVLPDQVPPANSGVFAPFFGVPALTVTLAYNLAQRTGARAVMAYAKRIPGAQFELVFLPVPEGLYDSEEDVALAALNQGVEATVNDAPEQYQWEYKRFRKQPNRGPNVYRQPRKEQQGLT